ncbi:MAG: hypothetical protein ACK4I8_02990 [Armatimonadota bacterium]
MAVISERSVVANLRRISVEELVTLAEQTQWVSPDLNFDILQRLVEHGFQVTQVFWLTRYGPAYGGPGIYFLLKHPDGREAATIVVPGRKVAEFIRNHLEEWMNKGIAVEYADIPVQKSKQGRD